MRNLLGESFLENTTEWKRAYDCLKSYPSNFDWIDQNVVDREKYDIQQHISGCDKI